MFTTLTGVMCCLIVVDIMARLWPDKTQLLPEHKPKLSPFVETVIQSTVGENDWVYSPAIYLSDGNQTADSWDSAKLKLMIVFKHIKSGPPGCYGGGGGHAFTEEELDAVKAAFDNLKTQKLLDRMNS